MRNPTKDETDVATQIEIRIHEEVNNIDSLKLPALYEIVDPEALDAVFNRDSLLYVQFSFCEYKIIVASNGQIIIQECKTNYE